MTIVCIEFENFDIIYFFTETTFFKKIYLKIIVNNTYIIGAQGFIQGLWEKAKNSTKKLKIALKNVVKKSEKRQHWHKQSPEHKEWRKHLNAGIVWIGGGRVYQSEWDAHIYTSLHIFRILVIYGTFYALWAVWTS